MSGRYLGGAGGTERALYSMLKALENDYVDVVVARSLGGAWGTPPNHGTVYNRANWRWRGSSRSLVRKCLNPARRLVMPPYDVVMMQRWAHDVISTTRSSLSLVIPAGNAVAGLNSHFDKIALQAPDNVKFLGQSTPAALIPPPVLPLASEALRPRQWLPKDFLLTVFNPYGAIKGTGDLATAADEAPYPIVWCHSQKTLKFAIDATLHTHPKIIHVVDATPSELRYLYEACRAYLSFSTSEGFGWAIADALRYSPIVISRAVGILSYEESHQAGVHLIDADWKFDWDLLSNGSESGAVRNLDFVSPEAFRSALTRELLIAVQGA